MEYTSYPISTSSVSYHLRRRPVEINSTITFSINAPQEDVIDSTKVLLITISLIPELKIFIDGSQVDVVLKDIMLRFHGFL